MAQFKSFFNSNVDEELLDQLIEMGFDFDLSKAALKKSGNDIHKAIDYIREEGHGLLGNADTSLVA
jgi:hypothetical protein